jgi:hypothetical protein
MRQWVEGEEEEVVCTKVTEMLLMLVCFPSEGKVHVQLEFVNKISQLMLVLISLLGLQSQTLLAEAEPVKMIVVA